jgi:hypothetical protein
MRGVSAAAGKAQRPPDDGRDQQAMFAVGVVRREHYRIGRVLRRNKADTSLILLVDFPDPSTN